MGRACHPCCCSPDWPLLYPRSKQALCGHKRIVRASPGRGVVRLPRGFVTRPLSHVPGPALAPATGPIARAGLALRGGRAGEACWRTPWPSRRPRPRQSAPPMPQSGDETVALVHDRDPRNRPPPRVARLARWLLPGDSRRRGRDPMVAQSRWRPQSRPSANKQCRSPQSAVRSRNGVVAVLTVPQNCAIVPA